MSRIASLKQFGLRALVSAFALTCLAAMYSFLPLTAPHLSNSPDENANGFFSRLFNRTSVLYWFDEITSLGGDIIHPRSVTVSGDFQVPGGFIGIPVLYGSAAKLFGEGVIPYMTPVLAALAVAAWGLLLASRFGRAAGVAGALVLAVHPAWWYAASRTLYPNLPFVALLIIAAWLFFSAPILKALQRRELGGLHLLRRSDAAMAGLCTGFALAVRTSEAYWLLLGTVVLVIYARKKLAWDRLIVWAVFSALALAPFLMMNQQLYGNFLATGYGNAAETSSTLPQGFGNTLLGPLRPWLFPLGFAPRNALANAWTYGIAFFWWWSALLVAIGAAFAWKVRKGTAKLTAVHGDLKTVAVLGVTLAVWLVPFYGSWILRDNPDPKAVTIGTSYLRYWLPLFVLSTVPVAWWCQRLWDRRAALAPRAKYALAALAVAYVGASAATVFVAKGEGLLAVRGELRRYEPIIADIIARTTPQSVIVVDRADKFLFPYRQVIVPLRSESTYNALGRVSRFAELYYYGITLPEKDLEYLKREKLAPQGLTIQLVHTYGIESLYKLVQLAKINSSSE